MPHSNLTNFEFLKGMIDSFQEDEPLSPWTFYPCAEWPYTTWIKNTPLPTKIVGRMAYILNYGAIADDDIVLRRCGNTKCIRPVHLRAVNHGQTLKNLLKIVPDDPNQCVEWPLSRSVLGYGRITGDGDRHTVAAHRSAWESLHGPLSEDQHICHHCDNPPCVRISHLFVGDRMDNVRDALKKGRYKHGEDIHGARLSIHGVRKIRMLRDQGFTYKEIAVTMDVGFITVSDVIRRKTWKWVD